MILSDPKWKAGTEARKALVDTWKMGIGTASYEFQADGTAKWLGTNSPSCARSNSGRWTRS